MTTKLEKLLTGLEKMELKIEKLETKNEKAWKVIDNTIVKCAKKGVNIQEGVNAIDSTNSNTYYNTVGSLKEYFDIALSDEYADTDIFNWLITIKMKFETMYRTNNDIRETQEKITAQKAKIAELESELEGFYELPQVIQDFINKYGEDVKEWLRQNSDLPESKIQSDVEFDKKVKASVLKSKVERITGKITDAQYVSVGMNGDLNGYIEGERGRAFVQTISAGGWNIQCFHFRTLVQ